MVTFRQRQAHAKHCWFGLAAGVSIMAMAGTYGLHNEPPLLRDSQRPITWPMQKKTKLPSTELDLHRLCRRGPCEIV